MTAWIYEIGDRKVLQAGAHVRRPHGRHADGELDDDAGRTAYLACFHAAQAFIFEKTGKSAKTHNGVRTEFVRLTKDDKRVDPALRRFLFKSYDFKSAADYFTGGDDAISPRLAEDAVATAKRFVAHLIDLI